MDKKFLSGVGANDVFDYLNDDEIDEFVHAKNVIDDLVKTIKIRKINDFYLHKGCLLVRTLKMDEWADEVRTLTAQENGFTILDNALEIMQILNDGMPNLGLRSVLKLTQQGNLTSIEYEITRVVAMYSNNGHEFLKEYIRQSDLDASPKEAAFIRELEKSK